MLRHLTWLAGLLALACACTSAPPSGSGHPPSAATTAAPAASGSAHEVTSADGKAKLTIPDGTLPDGVDVGSIKVSSLQAPPEFAGSDLIAAYELEPAGTQFTSPLTLTLQLDSLSDNLPEIVLISDAQVELLDSEMDITGDGETASATISVPVSHFSTVIAYRGNVKAQISSPADQPLHKQFDVGITVTRERESVYLPIDVEQLTGVWKILKLYVESGATPGTHGPITLSEGRFETSIYLSPFSPRAPGSSVEIDDTPFVLKQLFECELAGRQRIRYRVRTTQAIRVRSVGFSMDTDFSHRMAFFLETHPFFCMDAQPTPSPKPTPTKAPTPTPAITPEVLTSLPEGAISGVGLRYNETPPGLVFSLFWHGFPISAISLEADGVNGGAITELAFNPAAPGWNNLLLAVDAPGVVKLKKVILTREDGTQVDITQPFVELLGTDTLTVGDGGESCWGSLC